MNGDTEAIEQKLEESSRIALLEAEIRDADEKLNAMGVREGKEGGESPGGGVKTTNKKGLEQAVSAIFEELKEVQKHEKNPCNRAAE
eukprot:1393511-Amorphochlora_amoeboformis.AAC.1